MGRTFLWGFLDDIRTLFESKDASLLTLIENVREIKAMVDEGIALGTFPAKQEQIYAEKRTPPKRSQASRELALPYKPRPPRKVYRSSLYFRHRSPKKKTDQIHGGVGGS